VYFVFLNGDSVSFRATLYLSHSALFQQGMNLFYSMYASNHDLYLGNEKRYNFDLTLVNDCLSVCISYQFISRCLLLLDSLSFSRLERHVL